ncbi:MAG TPA: surface carbohydrate biosynthesis protein [Paracoccaceae bacterium]|nr:surface carbohydrate biosynthesis protein [Paracoccaceae bacterium]
MPLAQDSRHLILPCETRVREFDAKLLLACCAADRGWRVSVGDIRAINRQAARLPQGIYIAKGVTRRQAVAMRTMTRLGHTVTAWDEEGLVYVSPELYLATKVDAMAFDVPTLFFSWGEANASAWRGHPSYAGTPIVATGNPRADLLRPELRGYFSDEVERLRRAHGKFILVNSNFASLNHLRPGEGRHTRLLQNQGRETDPEQDSQLGFAVHKELLFKNFLGMVPALARQFPEHKVILRPHPSENPETWREALSNYPNAEVVYEGNAVAWLLASAVLIHNGCTTAVESYLLDRPAIAYRPVVSEDYDLPLPNALSVSSFTVEELFERVGEALSTGLKIGASDLDRWRAIAREHIASSEGPSACDRILDVLEELDVAGESNAGMLHRLSARVAIAGRRARKRLKSIVRSEPRGAMARHMFPPISHAEVIASIRRFGTLLDRFGDLQTKELDSNLFSVWRER